MTVRLVVAFLVLLAVGLLALRSGRPSAVRRHVPVLELRGAVDIMVDERPPIYCNSWITIRANGQEERCT